MVDSNDSQSGSVSPVSLDEVLERALTEIPDSVAIGYLDSGTDMLLAAKVHDGDESDLFDLMAEAIVDVFESRHSAAFEQSIRRASGSGGAEESIRESICFTDSLVHYAVAGDDGSGVVCVVCKKDANMGIVISKSRSTLPRIADVL